MAGQPKKRAKTKATEKSAALKKAAAEYAKEQRAKEKTAKAIEVAPEVAAEVVPFIEAEPLDPDGNPEFRPTAISAPEPKPAVVKPGVPVMYFAVPHPGFIPEGFEIKGAVSGSPTVVRGFIPDK